MNRRSFLYGSLAVTLAACSPKQDWITVGSKNFTEQLLLGEMLAQALENARALQVSRRLYLAGTYICHQALLAGRIDMYVEYTGTALAAILKEQPAQRDTQAVYRQVRDEYAKNFDLDVLPPLGFDNTFAIAMRGRDARNLGLTRLSELAHAAPKLRIGVGYEFLERKDGYNGLVSTYDLRFADAPRVMDLGLLYRALQSGQVDVIAGSNTDGLIAALGLTVLQDDRHYFPPYDAVIISRRDTLTRYPQAGAALRNLCGKITANDMRRLNYAVDAEKRDASQVAQEYLYSQNLLTSALPPGSNIHHPKPRR